MRDRISRTAHLSLFSLFSPLLVFASIRDEEKEAQVVVSLFSSSSLSFTAGDF
jgi:hypothetical protein